MGLGFYKTTDKDWLVRQIYEGIQLLLKCKRIHDQCTISTVSYK